MLRLDVEVDAGLLGYSAQCLLWLTIAPARLGGIARTLATDPQTAFVGLTTGAHNCSPSPSVATPKHCTPISPTASAPWRGSAVWRRP
ncbi:hypothetical protein SAZ11_06195 [Streptomyces sp. FXJ1.4098]|nr:hypothetical protein [Streptomyces sp. FXJ1.4098]